MVEIHGVSERQWKGIDTQVAQLMREPIVYTRLPSGMQIGKGKNKAEYFQATDIFYVNEGNRFSYEDKNTGARKIRDAIITYLTLPIHIDEKDIDASSSEGITPLLVQMEVECRAKMQEKIQKIILHGSAHTGGRGICTFQQDGDVVEQTYAFEATLTWTNNLQFSLEMEIARGLLRAAHIMPPYKLWMTPGIRPTLRANVNATTGVSDWKLFQQDWMNSGVISGEKGTEPFIPDINQITETDALYNGTLSTATQAFLLWKDDINCNYIAEAYPIHRAGIPNKEFEGDIDYALRWAGCFLPKNPKGAVYVHTGATDVAY
ncbi:MAG: major capsid protein, HK97-like [Lokiarchaeia virus VerdaV1]|uniref:Major capsid protein, HK97-like n=1 Tax=Lokiarchaeia virus VerdaV1 TaxID=3070170 RepID=A0AA35G7A2_9CAUD|nr:MAG: major capsid protein, HK97-like [Lokiarchaeia virus VerdaV1]BDI54856.1 MAG: major capsid protein, HK97-like [Lokiarchaeia virus VerdaV1]